MVNKELKQKLNFYIVTDLLHNQKPETIDELTIN